MKGNTANDQKALAEATLTTESTEPSCEQSYLRVIRRRQVLMAEMDALQVEENGLIEALGGPDEAKKLVAMPGKIL